MRNIMTAQRNVNFHARRHVVTKDFHNRTHRLAALIGITANFCDHKLAVFGITGIRLRNQNLLTDAPIIRHHQAKTMVAIKAPNNLRQTPLQHFNNHALFAATPVNARHPHQHNIAIKYFHHFLRPQEHIPGTVRRHKVTRAFFIALHASLGQFHLVSQAIHTAAITDQLTITAHGNQPATQRLGLILIVIKTHLFTQILISHRLANFCHQLHDVFTTGNGFIVLFSFA